MDINDTFDYLNSKLKYYKNTPENNRAIQGNCKYIIENLSRKPDDTYSLDLTKYNEFINTFSQMKTNNVFQRLFRTSKTETEINNLIERIDPKNWEEKNRGAAAVISATNGSANSLELILKIGSISEEDRGRAVREAVIYGKIDCLRLLLRDGAKISEEHRRKVISDAFRRKQFDCLTIFLQSEFISQEDRGYAVVRAAAYGNIDYLELLLADGEIISKEVRGEAVVEAARRGTIDCLRLLLADGAIISEEDRGQAVYKAVISAASSRHFTGNINGQIDCLRFLLADGAIISEKDRGEAVLQAVENKEIDLLTLLLPAGAVISEEDRGKAVKNAVEKEHAQIVTTLLANGPISEEDRREAVKNAVNKGHAQIVTTLLANEPISEWDQGIALTLAAMNGKAQIVTTLLANGATISEEDRGEAVKNAVNKGRAQIVSTLLANGPISEEDRGEAVISATQYGYVEITTQLLANGATISKWDRGKTVIWAARNGYAQIVTQLLANGPISRFDKGDAFMWASRRGSEDIIFLLEQQRTAAPRAYITPPAHPVAARIYVQTEEFAEHPELYLRNVAENGLPSGVTFMNPNGTEEPGIDAGGLTKQFICQLAEHLLNKEIIERDDLRFPCSNKDNLTPYTQLGQLLSHIDLANATRTDSLYIGEIFDPRTYALLKILAEPENELEPPALRKEKEFLAIANTTVTTNKQPLVDFLNISNPSEADIAGVKEYLADIKRSALPKEISTKKLRNICFMSLAVKEYHRTLSAILSGLSDVLPWKILALGADIAKSLQGTIDERLLDKFTLTSTNSVVQQKLTWIKEKITSELADPEKVWIKRFLKSVTSQSVMPTGNIEIRESSDTMCHAHTCFCQLDLPSNATSKEVFFERLGLLMAEEGFGST